MTTYQQKRIREALKYERILTDWEKSFIESLYKLQPDTELSDGRNKTLNRISGKIARYDG